MMIIPILWSLKPPQNFLYLFFQSFPSQQLSVSSSVRRVYIGLAVLYT